MNTKHITNGLMLTGRMRSFRKLMGIQIPVAIFAVGIGLQTQIASASIVWRADFESYVDEQAITLNNSGADDTFEAHLVYNVGTGGAGIFDAEATPNASFVTGNAAEWYRTATGTGSTTTDIRRRNFSLAPGGALILSFDAKETGSTANSVGVDFIESSAEQRLTGGASLGIGLGVGNFRRITMVANRTGSPIDLPGTMTDLQTNQVVLYTKDSGGTYAEAARANVDPLYYSSNVNGFFIRTFNAATTWQWSFDNFVLADELDARDQTTDINILEWSPGVLASNAIPEPGVMTLVLGGALVLWRRNSRAAGRRG